MIDFHCHLDLMDDHIGVIQNLAKEKTYVLSVTTTPKAFPKTSKLTKGNNRIRTALGLHPQLAHQRLHELDMFNSLLPEAKYVGEIGLDGSKGFKDHWSVQINVFRHILQSVNSAGGRIMSIHSRASIGAVLSELSGIEGIPVLHWFMGNKTELNQAIDRGCWFSVGPAMLATKRGQELVSLVPQNRVLTESDGPFAKWKGRPLMPWDVELSFEQLAKIWGTTSIGVKEKIYSNFRALVSLT